MENKKLTQQHLKQFTGDLERFRHSFNPQIIYTPGVRFLAERAGAYWLIDAIASYFGTNRMARAVESDPRLAGLQFWRLDVRSDDTALLSARVDRDEEPFITQVIPFADFPLDDVDIWAGFDGVHWTLYLPSEH